VKGPRARVRHNPLADGSLSPPAGLAFSLTFIAASFVVTFLVAPWALLPWGIILAIIVGLALHLFPEPGAGAFGRYVLFRHVRRAGDD
jgi:4-hydroxybenzoate polyprenyltransferase